VYAVLGVLGGFVSVIFTKSLTGLREKFMRLPKKTLWFQPVAGGIAVGLMGWFVPQVLGVGYKYVGDALNGNMALRLMLILLVLKLLGVVVSYASGNAGGIFGPSLFLGAMLGGCVGTVAHNLAPAYVASPGVYALVGMGTAFAGIVRAPMTSVLMIFEITRDYSVIVPLMISNLVSFFISQRFQPEPIYEVLAHQDGIHLPTVETRAGPGQPQVIQAMRPAPVILRTQMTVQDAASLVQSSECHAWPVQDELGIVGMLRFDTLQKAVADRSAAQTVGELINRNPVEFPHLHTDHSLGVALERLGTSQLDALPVVSRADVHKLEGIVTLQDVLRIYGFASSTSSNHAS
jgi:chloride channel protein, CIC family